MAEIIQRRQRATQVSYSHEFTWRTDPGSGFSFTCDERGEIIVTDVNRQNVEGCLSGAFDVIDHGVVRDERSYTVPAVLRCDCGADVALEGFTNTCRCGADYNMSGQRLASRSQWGEETGETLGEILAIA